MSAIGSRVDSIAGRLEEAALTRQKIPVVAQDLSGPIEAYAVQRALNARWAARGRRQVGWKVGATSGRVRALHGMSEPDYGALFADTTLAEDGLLELSQFVAPRLEPEVALVLGRDIDADQPTIVDVLHAIHLVVPAMEIVDSRVEEEGIGFLDSIADNATAGGAVVGRAARSFSSLDGETLTARMLVDGLAADVAPDATVMHPVETLLWLSRALGSAGDWLRAGQIVLTGALTASVPAVHATRVIADLGRLGTVGVRVAGRRD
jgi:2-keto-4-pentenoate hydratase